MKLAIIGVCSLLVMNTLAYTSGPPDSACGTLRPDVTQHGASPQTGPTPYNITLASDQYAASRIMSVTLSGTDTDNIKGFLIYARKADGSAPTTPVGSFSGVDSATNAKVQDKCGTGSGTGMSHKQQINQRTVSLQWNTPSTLQGNIEFIYTIVKKKDTYWVGATSAVVWDGQGARPTTTIPPVTITVEGCADTKSCYQSSGCTDTNCDYLVTFAKQSGNKVDFELRVSKVGENQYAAVGIADGETMDNVTVIACQADGTGKSEVKHYFARSKTTGVAAVAENVTAGGTSEASISNGMMSCRFTYDNDIAIGSIGEYKDLSAGEYHLSVAYGSVANGQIGKHTKTPSPSAAANLFTSEHVNLERSGHEWFETIQDMVLSCVIILVLSLLMVVGYLVMYFNESRVQTKKGRMVPCLMMRKAGLALWFIIPFVVGNTEYPYNTTTPTGNTEYPYNTTTPKQTSAAIYDKIKVYFPFLISFAVTVFVVGGVVFAIWKWKTRTPSITKKNSPDDMMHFYQNVKD